MPLKTRDELPWLYYPECDRVRIINSHNGGSGLPDPIALWVPSLDTVGNLTTTLTDLSGGGRTGTLTGMTPASDWPADTDNGGVRALDFDGSNDYVNVLSTLFSVEKTICGWIKLNANKDQWFFSHRSTASISTANFQFYQFPTDGDNLLRVSAANTTGSALVAPRFILSSPTLGIWYHLAAVFSGTTISTYANGVFVESATLASGTFANVASRFTIGAASWNTSFGNVNGRIDNVRIYDSALDASQISSLYAAGLGRSLP